MAQKDADPASVSARAVWRHGALNPTANQEAARKGNLDGRKMIGTLQPLAPALEGGPGAPAG